jgi:hypothetical protein
MTKGEERVIRDIVRRLREERLGSAPGYVPELERGARLYVETWLVGPLECLLPESRDVDLAVCMGRTRA